MNKRKIKRFIYLVLVMVFSFSFGVFANSNLETISAYLNRGISIKYNGEYKNLFDAQNNRIYPITYNDSTYLPVRAISNILGVDVDWDPTTQTVLLGDNDMSKDFINSISPYASEFGLTRTYFPSTKNQLTTICNNTYNRFLKIFSNDILYYNLQGNYKKLIFDVYTEYKLSDGPLKIVCIGDNNKELCSVDVVAFDLPQTVILDLTEVQQLKIQSNQPGEMTGRGPVYIFNAKIE